MCCRGVLFFAGGLGLPRGQELGEKFHGAGRRMERLEVETVVLGSRSRARHLMCCGVVVESAWENEI